MKTVVTVIAVFFFAGMFTTPCFSASPVDIFDHAAGIWALPDDQDHKRWVVIHNLEEAKKSDICHIEVIARKKGDPKWSITRICPHMAITVKALAHCVTGPLTSGAVYPESFNDAYAAWKKGTKKEICTQSVMDCMPTK